jgi:hypothetical protein
MCPKNYDCSFHLQLSTKKPGEEIENLFIHLRSLNFNVEQPSSLRRDDSINFNVFASTNISKEFFELQHDVHSSESNKGEKGV